MEISLRAPGSKSRGPNNSGNNKKQTHQALAPPCDGGVCYNPTSRLTGLGLRNVKQRIQVRHSPKDFTSTASRLIHPSDHAIGMVVFPSYRNGGSERLSKLLRVTELLVME